MGTEVTARVPVAVLGLGRMGTALANALLRCGHEVVVWNRTASRAAPVVARGAQLAPSAAPAISAAPVSIMCLLDYAAVAEVLRTPGASESLKGRTVVQLTSAMLEEVPTHDECVRRHGACLVTGGIMAYPSGIGRPETMIFYSGDEAAFAQYRDLLKDLGGALKYLGTNPCAAVTAYLTAGLFMMGSLAMFLESAAVAGGHGLSIREFQELALASGKVLEETMRESADRIAAARFDGDEATIDVLASAMDNVAGMFASTEATPRMTEALRMHLAAAIAAGKGNLDLAALFAGSPIGSY